MGISHSPLRYPGGKQVISRLVAHLIRLNGAAGGTYIEPYAGGAGVALALLLGEHVERVLINDADSRVYAFWRAILCKTENFVDLLRSTPLTVEEWTRQRDIYRRPTRHSGLRVGFATFYLNRCNRSGIIATGGVIGGQQQSGKWKLDARFNRVELERRVRQVALFAGRIAVSNKDAIVFLDEDVSRIERRDRPFVYLDPPYYVKGAELYLNSYTHDDHAALAKRLQREVGYPWILSYDNVREIRDLYPMFRQVQFSLDYSARERRVGSEVMIFRRNLAFPTKWIRTIPQRYITAADGAPPLPL